VGCSSNAYFTEFSLARLITCVDFINIGFKGFSDRDYRACGAQSLNPVLRNLDTLYKSGVHVEITCIFTEDNREALRAMVSHIAGISRDIPLQMMRFIPLEDVDVSQEPTIREAEEFCAELRETLDYVYLFNSPGTDYLHTYCPSCGNTIYQREFYGPMGAKLKTSPSDFPSDSRCPACHHKLNIIGCPAETTYQEGDFEGGYPFTRALEMVEAMLIAMGVDNKAMVVKAWEELLMNEGLQRLHVGIQHPRTYIQLLRQLGGVLNITDRAEAFRGASEFTRSGNHLHIGLYLQHGRGFLHRMLSAGSSCRGRQDAADLHASGSRLGLRQPPLDTGTHVSGERLPSRAVRFRYHR
jgi:hypothetical protein